MKRTLERNGGIEAEAVILAGGLSSRMGRDKARLRLGGKSLLARVKIAARAAGMNVRVIRKDSVERCGPIGGIWTALQRSESDGLLFLSCDMPFVPTDHLQKLRRKAMSTKRCVFTSVRNQVGFPLFIHKCNLPIIEIQIQQREFSLQQLARELGAVRVKAGAREVAAFFNINDVSDWQRAREMIGEPGKKRSA
jgi:molybdopterin-guanine dinucleotide biosynthesis protein A